MINDHNSNNDTVDTPEIPPLRPSLLSALIDHAEHGITIAEREGEETILIYVNKAFEKMTGYTADECLYKDCRFLQGDEYQPQIKKIREAIDTDVPVRVLLKNYRKDGTLFWNDFTITPYYDEVESIMYYIGVQKDVTDLVNMKEQLAVFQAQLVK